MASVWGLCVLEGQQPTPLNFSPVSFYNTTCPELLGSVKSYTSPCSLETPPHKMADPSQDTETMGKL